MCETIPEYERDFNKLKDLRMLGRILLDFAEGELIDNVV